MIIVESKNPNPMTSPFEKAAYAARALHYASIWYNREYGVGNWYIPEAFLGRRYKKAWKTIEFERQNAA